MGQGKSIVVKLTDDAAYAAGTSVRCVVMSDTHNAVSTPAHAALVPDGDIFIHCGDFTIDGTVEEVTTFNKWLGYLPHRYKVVVAGNHDLCCHPESYATNVAGCNWARSQRHANSPQGPLITSDPAAWRCTLQSELLSNATHYLEGEVVTLEVPGRGTLRLAGAPYTDVISISAMRAFSFADAEQAAALDAAFSDDAPLDVLVTHGPPRGVLDTFLGQSTGSVALAKKLSRMTTCPLFHVFGHVHKARGVQVGTTTSINAASVVGRHHILCENPAVVFDVPVQCA